MNFFNKYVRSGRYWKLWRCDLCSACLHVYFLWADVRTPIDMISCWNIACTYRVLFRGFQNSFSKCYIAFFLPYYTAEQYEEIIKHAFLGCSSLYLEKWEKTIYLVKMGKNLLFIWLNCKNKNKKLWKCLSQNL